MVPGTKKSDGPTSGNGGVASSPTSSLEKQNQQSHYSQQHQHQQQPLLLCLSNSNSSSTSSTCQDVSNFMMRVSYTVGPIGIASVLLYVGMWGILDCFLFPGNMAFSGFACIAMATVLAMMVHAWPVKKQKSVSYTVCTAMLGVCYWRGVWKLWDTFTFVLEQQSPLLQALLALGTGFAILSATDHFQPKIVGPAILFPPDKKNIYASLLPFLGGKDDETKHSKQERQQQSPLKRTVRRNVSMPKRSQDATQKRLQKKNSTSQMTEENNHHDVSILDV